MRKTGASDFILLSVSYDNGKKRVQALNCHFPYSVLKNAFIKAASQKQYSIDKPLTYQSRTTLMNKDKDRVTIFDEDDGTYLVEFEKHFKSIYESFGEREKREREYWKSLNNK